jgi:flagellar biosynthesis anti-sigma factor FlgM
MNINHTELNSTSHSQANSAHRVDNDPGIRNSGIHKKQIQERDEAELSDLARVMGKIHPYLEENPEIRTELIEELKTKIEDGSYNIPIEEIVNRMISGKD